MTVRAVAVKHAQKDLVVPAIEPLDDLERVLVGLVKVIGIVAALREIRIAQCHTRLPEREQERPLAALDA